MADDPKKRGAADRRLVSKQQHELRVLKEKFGITGQAAAGAQRVAGPKRASVEKYIRQKLKDGAY